MELPEIRRSWEEIPAPVPFRTEFPSWLTSPCPIATVNKTESSASKAWKWAPCNWKAIFCIHVSRLLSEESSGILHVVPCYIKKEIRNPFGPCIQGNTASADSDSFLMMAQWICLQGHMVVTPRKLHCSLLFSLAPPSG